MPEIQQHTIGQRLRAEQWLTNEIKDGNPDAKVIREHMDALRLAASAAYAEGAADEARAEAGFKATVPDNVVYVLNEIENEIETARMHNGLVDYSHVINLIDKGRGTILNRLVEAA